MSSVNVQNFTDARKLGNINSLLSDSIGRLSSGTQIAKPSDDPSGIGKVSKLTAQDKRAQAAIINVQNASSRVQTASGVLGSISSMLTRMSELAEYANDVTKSTTDVETYQAEFAQLQEELRQTVGGSAAEIGGTAVGTPKAIFDEVELFGSNPSGITIASGSQTGETLTIPETNLRDGALSDLFRQDASGNYLVSVTDSDISSKITAGLDEVTDTRSVLAGVSSRLGLAASRLTVESQNIDAAVSRIEDTDVATESTRLTKLNILLQSGTAMLTQANQTSSTVLKLLQI
jgi:flagellin